MAVIKYVCHSKRVLDIALRHGWKPGARYTNLRDVKRIGKLGFLDTDWKTYDFKRHLHATMLTRPDITVARDVERLRDLPRILDQACTLLEYARKVVIVPKAKGLANILLEAIPEKFVLGYSVPTQYGGTRLSLACFGQRPVHLLGGRPDRQRAIAQQLNVVSFDTNRFTLDAAFGDFFDGEKFRPHPVGGYERCLEASIKNMNALWADYRPIKRARSKSNDRA
ncbi:MAG: hypothetical protein K2P94_10900 [Rhodospirillaceae bacterium]|nr:hypothetical protein [Rhodospirillaceae bacterium]